MLKSLLISSLILLTSFTVFGQDKIIYGSNPKAGHYVNVNDIKLYYEVYGSGHPLLLMHGNGGSISSLSNQIPELAKYFKVIAVDSRAQGLSTDSEQRLSFSLMASDMDKLLNHLKIDSAYVLGWSDGGIIGLEMAIKYPKRIAKLITVGANYVADTTALPAKMIEDMKASSFSKLDLGTQREIISQSRFPKRAGLIYDKLNLLDLLHPHITLKQLHSIKAPTLVMAGDHDIIIDTHTLSLFHAIPHSELCIMPGAGHGLLIQKPALANEIIKEFLLTPYKDMK